jgi:hypothetical protein
MNHQQELKAHDRGGLTVVLAFVGLVCVVYLLDPTGWLGSDDSAYYNAAEQIFRGETIHRVHHHPSRLSAILPVTLSLAIFGHHPYAVILPAFLAGVACLLFIAWIGKSLWTWREGLIAAALMAAIPYFRVLSTAAYPDIYVCSYTAAALYATVRALKAATPIRSGWWAVAAAICIGLAASAKIIAVVLFAPIGLIFLLCRNDATEESIHPSGPITSTGPGGFAGSAGRSTLYGRMTLLSGLLIGGTIFFLFHGLLCLYVTGDFWFKLNALRRAEEFEPMLSAQHLHSIREYAALAWYRLTMPFRVHQSGWGWCGAIFWPAALAGACLNAKTRMLSLSAVSIYLMLSVVPVKFENGMYPFGFFNGRHVLFALVPFVICAARVATSLIPRRVVTPVGVGSAVVAAVAAFTLGALGPQGVTSFTDREQKALGTLIREVTELISRNSTKPIVMPASLYIRYRILVPPELRDRLFVAVDEAAPNWWRDATADIAARRISLPPPDEAILLATRIQKNGGAEPWDYGVVLPRNGLTAWEESSGRCTAIVCDASDRLCVWGLDLDAPNRVTVNK